MKLRITKVCHVMDHEHPKVMMLARAFLHSLRVLVRERGLNRHEKKADKLQNKISALKKKMPQKATAQQLFIKQHFDALKRVRGEEKINLQSAQPLAYLTVAF